MRLLVQNVFVLRFLRNHEYSVRIILTTNLSESYKFRWLVDNWVLVFLHFGQQFILLKNCEKLSVETRVMLRTSNWSDLATRHERPILHLDSINLS